MTGAEWAAVLLAGGAVVLSIALWTALSSTKRALSALRDTVEDLRRERAPLQADLQRMDQALRRSQAVSATRESASRLAYLVLSNPLIKLMAFGTGTSRAVERFRQRDRDRHTIDLRDRRRVELEG